jgi:hypothetical protein
LYQKYVFQNPFLQNKFDPEFIHAALKLRLEHFVRVAGPAEQSPVDCRRGDEMMLVVVHGENVQHGFIDIKRCQRLGNQ